MALCVVHAVSVVMRRITLPQKPFTSLIQSGFMPNYNCWTKHGERGVMMEDSEEEEDDDNYHMFPEYGYTGMGGELKIKRH